MPSPFRRGDWCSLSSARKDERVLKDVLIPHSLLISRLSFEKACRVRRACRASNITLPLWSRREELEPINSSEPLALRMS